MDFQALALARPEEHVRAASGMTFAECAKLMSQQSAPIPETSPAKDSNKLFIESGGGCP